MRDNRATGITVMFGLAGFNINISLNILMGCERQYDLIKVMSILVAGILGH